MNKFGVIFALLFFVSMGLGLTSYDKSTPFPPRLYSKYRQPWNLVRTANRETITFWVALKQRNLDSLKTIFEQVTDPSSPEYGNYRSIEEITSLIAPSHDVQKKVENWIRSVEGVKELKHHGDAIEVRMTGRGASRLFKTPFYLFEHATAKVQTVRQVSGFSLPAEIAAHVEFVSGLTEFPYYNVDKALAKKRAGAGSPDASYAFVIPETVRNVYSIPDGTVVKNLKTTQGVIEFSPVGGPLFTDLVQFAQQAGEIFTNISNIIGPFSQGSNDGESVLDVELITNVAPKAYNYYITFENGWAYEMALSLFTLPNAPLVNSVSYGWPEYYTCQSAITHAECNNSDTQTYVNRANTEFMKVAARGLGVFIATQDEGAPSEANEDCSLDTTSTPVYAIYPSSSPYVTAVSATTIVESNGQLSRVNDPPICGGAYPCAHGKSEVPCSVANTYYQWTTGGGFSLWGARPSYQNDVVNAYLASGTFMPPTNLFTSTMRGYADVSAVGARILTINYASIQPSAGTSASTPIFAAVATLLNDRRLNAGKKPLGFLNPLLYQMAKANPATFQDITTGDNRCTIGVCCTYGFGATNGWDPTSGLGTPNFSQMAKYIDALP